MLVGLCSRAPPRADPFAGVAALLAADVVVGNLESPIRFTAPDRPAVPRAIGASRVDAPLLRVETVEVEGWRVGFMAFATLTNHPGRA